MENDLKIPSTVSGRNRPEARAHGAWQPATRGRPNAGWATAWQPSPAGQLAGAFTARGMARRRARRRLGGGSTAARCCQRSRGGHGEGAGQGGEDRGAPERWVDGEAVPTASGGGVHRRGGGPVVAGMVE
jgi:hypothetical protein